ncbi:Outer membrane protein 22 [Neorhizobium galegae bv. officinalis bv. officinalis str. HAMBI 1141]|uniref:Outer membrane protein 22 n=1 Tax=Neorhizobium galegae bv. officinalis bv. officinalis str. HAMBI 1141 TaxID=1028801 RepID=A0A068T984_NEOGA|nr:outer membrane protein [Neorhizobium galegae]CDN53865.1 Outer membrane protein 22 [Neorhizobium galegae bv. officinalis bv. officinalis str. HAMBI 1141]
MPSMRTRFGLSAAFAMLLSQAAMAADLDNSYVQAPYGQPATYDWTGAYVGGHAGVASSHLNPFSDGRGLAAGAQAGYNLQFNSAVLGAEVEGAYSGGADQNVHGGKLEEQWRLAAKAKVGVGLDKTLLYGTAGYAMTKFDNGNNIRRGPGWEGGYLVGGGVEQAFGNGLSAKVEYNYIVTPDVKTTTDAGTTRADINSHVIKAGINLRF